MKKHFDILAIVLCLLFLLTATGCETDPATTDPTHTSGTVQPVTVPPSTQAPSTDPTQTEPEPRLDAAQLYFDALAQHNTLEDFRYNLDRTDTMTTGPETFVTASAQQIEVLDRGTENFALKLTENVTNGEYKTVIQEIFIQDQLFLRVNGNGFASTMTVEECNARYLGADMINPALYKTTQAEIINGKTILHFSDAAELESWLVTDADTLISAEAEITINQEGALHKIIYQADYLRANIQMNTKIELFCRPSVIDKIEPPPAADEFPELDCIDAPKLMQQAYCLMLSSQSLTFQQSSTCYIDAAGYYDTQSYSINTWGSGSNRKALMDLSLNIIDPSTGNTYSQSFVERFENGKYSYVLDGGAPQTTPGITAEDVDAYITDYINEALLSLDYIADIQCTDLGSLLLFEITGNEDLGNYHKGQLCSSILTDANVLDDLATNYRTDEVQYYFAIDIYTGLPTAMGLYYEGVHTIEGEEYWLGEIVDSSVYCASMESYAAITEKTAPDDTIEDLATPLFYHVTGDNSEEMWLLGTIHVGDNRTGYLPDEIYDAFNSSDALAVECNTRTFEDQLAADAVLQQAAALAYFYTDGSMTADHIDNEEFYQLAMKYMKATGNNFHNALFMKISMWAGSIENYYLRQAYNLSSDKGMDNRLMIMAEECGKPIWEVESNLFQIQMLTGWSEELQLLLLEEAISIDALEYMLELDELYEMWCSGDEAALSAYINEEAPEMTDEERKLYEEYNKAMSTDRNAEMAKVAIEYLESGDTVFYAVGLAHVLAEDGLVNALRDAGYTVELVTYE